METLRTPYVALALTLLAEGVILAPPPFALTDHLVLWYVGHLVLTGSSPYEPAVWVAAASRFDSPHFTELALAGGVGVWPYPPWTGFLFVPFGALPVEVGPWVLHLSYVIVGVAAGIILARQVPWPGPGAYAAALVLFAAFQPFVIAARWGQFTAFLLAGMALALHGRRSNSVGLVVVGVLLLSLKPSVTALVGAAVVALLISDRAWRTLAATAAALALVVAVTWWRYPEWVATAATGATDRVAALGRFAGTLSLARGVAGEAWIVTAALLVLSAVAACALSVLRAPAATRSLALIAAAAVTTLVLVPYLLWYDHILLVPAIYVALFAGYARIGALRGVYAATLVLVVTVGPWALYLVGIFRPTQALSGLVPLLFALLLLASTLGPRTSAGSS